jgi:uncharacterized membrane protein
MQSRGKWVGTIASATAFLAYQFLIHRVTVSGQTTPVAITLILAPLVVTAGWFFVLELGLRRTLLLISALVFPGWAIISMVGLPHPAILLGLPHLVTNLFLLWFFARTLKAGRTPLITSISQRIHGSITPDLQIYTRRITWAWSLFFALQIIVSIVLYIFAPLQAWSMFINLLNAPLIALMFIGEYTYRMLRYRDHKSSIFSGLQIFARDTPVTKVAKRR